MNAIIFDFDGVILDSQRGWDRIVEQTYRKTFPAMESLSPHLFRGRSERDAFRYLSGLYPAQRTLAEHLLEVHAEAGSLYRTSPLMPGVRELFERLRAMDIPFGIGSSATRPWIESSLEHHSIRDLFWSLATADDVARTKPEPDVYLLAARQLGMDPADCIVIEDAPAGVRAAKAAGMYCIGYTADSTPQILAEADMHIRHFDELDADRLRAIARRPS